ncbi:MAG: cobalamin biosynthesis protein CbiG [Caulobacterales bacterium]|nr:cobalamin biosynthesis protein CbiG [Caulobacterales bacterium]
MSRLFSAYVMVDWSAAATPRTGKDSIWIGVIKRDIRFRPTFEAHNPATRDEAMKVLGEVLADLRRRNERALVGFDFALAYPEGTARALDLKVKDWSGLWAFMAANVVDKPTNVNNRFAVAAKMNRLMTDQPWPFWGCPANDAQRWLSTTKPTADASGLPQFRRAEKLVQLKAKGTKSVWQVFGNGTVGSQAIVGIPRVKALADPLGDKARVWPFQTGWKTLTPADVDGLEAVIAEVSPVVAEARPEPGEVPDRAQVRALCEHFLKLDEAGDLGAAFGPGAGAEPEVVAVVESEEGWILGI